MKLAADFRSIARDSLRGKWGIAVIVGLVAVLLSGSSNGGGGPEFQFNLDSAETCLNFNIAGQTIFSIGGGPNSEIGSFLVSHATYITIVTISLALVLIALGSIIEIGYARFNLDLIDKKPVGFEQLFLHFPIWKTALCARLLRFLYVLLWSLLLIIPGIIASYSYAMTDFILAENPNMTASDAIEASKRMMDGNKWRLFCLRFSFIGWSILASLTLGIGNLWLNPYRSAADAAFFREISGTEQSQSDIEFDIVNLP